MKPSTHHYKIALTTHHDVLEFINAIVEDIYRRVEKFVVNE